ncbi:Alpha/Beta hydrolase protein [Flammula alnicola]|nr:Alpha/Beta hydrolase protein [Flammula alnicola]
MSFSTLRIRDLLTFALTAALIASNACVLAQATFDWESITASDTLSWVGCYSNATQCARLNAPLNYSDPSAGTTAVAVLRFPSPMAGTDSYRGPVIFSPGGLGGSAIDQVLELGGMLSSVIGPQFDLVAFDVRGAGHTTPLISFFKTDAERAAFDLGPDEGDPTATPDALPRQWARFQVFGRLAQDRDDGFLAHVTTDNVARDMLHIVQAFGETKLQYWGISYGTVLGATFASLFPSKVERLIIDGVFDMEGYYSADWSAQLLDADKVQQAFFNECFKAGPTACAFYASSSAKIAANLNALYDKVLAQPIPAYSPSLPEYGVVDHATLKNAVFTAAERGRKRLFQLSVPNFREAVAAIACADGTKVTDTPATLSKYLQSISSGSSFSSIVGGFRVLCSGWRINPNSFKGPIMGNTSFPMLVIGNTADPVTPISDAKKTATHFLGSVVLTQDALGHTSFTNPSECTLGFVQGYFQNGTLPAAGTVCQSVGDLFPVASNGSKLSEGSFTLAPPFVAITFLKLTAYSSVF